MKKIIIAAFSALVVFTSCAKYLDVNTDPNNPATAPYNTIFPAATMQTGLNYGGFLVTTGSIWAQHFTQNNTANQYNDIDAYDVNSSTHNVIYIYEFSRGLVNYADVIKQSAAAGDWRVHLAATCMLAFSTQVLADCWDKVPYSEALQGSANVTPKWDNGEDIYVSLIQRLDDALSQNFDLVTNTSLGNDDYLFKGDLDSWKKFANTLKLKLYLRQTKVNPSVATAGITACLNSPIGFVTDAKITAFENANGKYNPFYGTNIASSGLGTHNHRASNTMLNFLDDNSDPRKDKFYAAGSAAGGVIIGLDQGDFHKTTVEVPNNSLATGRWGATDPVYFFSEPQVRFMIAEAKEIVGQDGKADYDAGVKASFTMWGLDGSSFVETGGAYEYPATDKIKAIITQKWVAACMRTPIEAWFDHSRTGYPDFLTVSKASILTGAAMPKRFIFPESEVNSNPNTPTYVAVDVPVWWAK